MSPSTEEVAFDTPETVTDTDPPQARLDLPPRTLEFRIMVGSGTSRVLKNPRVRAHARARL
jgi:hypothetical protein